MRADANGGSNAEGLIVFAAHGLERDRGRVRRRVQREQHAQAKEIALMAFTNGHQSGANSLAFLCTTSAATHIFEVRNDHNVVIPLMPTSSAGLPSGALWNNLGLVNIV